MSQSNTRPIDTLTDGALKASIWRNENKNGVPFYSVTLSRRYRRDDGEWAENNSFSGLDLLKIGRLAEQAHSRAMMISQLELDIDGAARTAKGGRP